MFWIFRERGRAQRAWRKRSDSNWGFGQWTKVDSQGEEWLLQVEKKWKRMRWAKSYIKGRHVWERGRDLSCLGERLCGGGGLCNGVTGPVSDFLQSEAALPWGWEVASGSSSHLGPKAATPSGPRGPSVHLLCHIWRCCEDKGGGPGSPQAASPWGALFPRAEGALDPFFCPVLSFLLWVARRTFGRPLRGLGILWLFSG